MTRMHDGSPPPLLRPKTSVQSAGASHATDEVSGSMPGGSAGQPVRDVRDVLVSYDEFKQRRQLRLRVMAAFERVEREHTLDGELGAVAPVQDPP